ncbi:hypothetical protein HN014_22365 (plasmid) [Aquimarina sp. TRL1]|uniref:hypothetical protein n=1 Tax=Aquimarina sp. (strain TRL1) TaxID=2736252 RepID=UPI00158917CD|nr:hypothetical protein [Aquimarina sp. TRL1]QKX07746.1 hypothetical protein HN014_22365 [Aquimarina sp. TRL1]
MEKSNFAAFQLEKETDRQINLYTKNATNIHSFFRENCNCVVYTFERQNKNKKDILALGFKGRSNKKSFFVRFENVERRKKYIEDFFDGVLQRYQSDLQRKKKAKELKTKMADSIKVGTICQGSWGYEQTNREFYQVVAKPSKFKVVIRAISDEIVPNSHGHDSCYVKPIRDDFSGEEETKLITQYGIKIHRSCTVHPCDENGKYYRSWGY